MLPLLKIHLPLRNVNGKSKCYEKAFVKSCQSNGWYVKSYSEEKGINDFCLMLNFFLSLVLLFLVVILIVKYMWKVSKTNL